MTSSLSAGSTPGLRALVTGAGTRLGRAIAERLGRDGARVAVHYHASQSGAEAALESIQRVGGDGILLQADLSLRDQARALVDRATQGLGGLDLLVVNAANFERVRFDEVDDASWDSTLELNLSSAFALAQRATPALRAARGSIVFITCSSATTPFKNYLPYVVSKGALRQLMRVLALELAPGVRVNAVAPGTVLPPPEMDAATQARLAAQIPLGRIGEAGDVAEAVAYLAGAPFVTGHELCVDGGRSLAKSERFA